MIETLTIGRKAPEKIIGTHPSTCQIGEARYGGRFGDRCRDERCAPEAVGSQLGGSGEVVKRLRYILTRISHLYHKIRQTERRFLL